MFQWRHSNNGTDLCLLSLTRMAEQEEDISKGCGDGYDFDGERIWNMGKRKKKSMYEYQVNALIATQTYVEISSFSNTVKLFLENILKKCLI